MTKQPEHGTPQCYWRGCRETQCSEANTAYVAARRRAKREAELPFPYYAPWTLEMPARRPSLRAYKDFAAIRKAVNGIALGEGVIPEPLVLRYWYSEIQDWADAYRIPEGTALEDLPWRR